MASCCRFGRATPPTRCASSAFPPLRNEAPGKQNVAEISKKPQGRERISRRCGFHIATTAARLLEDVHETPWLRPPDDDCPLPPCAFPTQSPWSEPGPAPPAGAWWESGSASPAGW